MALSNLLNEPRREITEQIAGVAIVSVPLAIDYGVVWYWGYTSKLDLLAGMLMIGGCMGLTVLTVIMALHLIHWMGEMVCDLMDDFNLDPRPKQRYRR